jgi:hypothetical protein
LACGKLHCGNSEFYRHCSKTTGYNAIAFMPFKF